MADLGSLGDIGAQISSKLVGGAVWIVIVFIVGGGLAILMYYFLIYKRKFDINVIIRSQRADNRTERIEDKAAILTDRKTKQRYFKLWNFKIEMPVPKFEVLESSRGVDYLNLYQKGDEEFYFLKPPKINKTFIQKTDGEWIPWAEHEHKVMDAEVAYWNVKKKQDNKDMFSRDKLWVKALELAPQVLSIIALIFILWIFLDKLPSVLNSLQQVAAEINQYNRAQVVTETAYSLPLLFKKWK